MQKLICLLVICLMWVVCSARADVVVQYNFDEGSGSVAGDSSGNGYDLSPVGSGSGASYSWVAGVTGTAIGTSSTNDSYLTATISSTAISPYYVIVDVDVKPFFTVDDSNPKIFSISDGFALEMDKANDSMRFIGMAAGNWYWTAISGVTEMLMDGSWHHITAIYDGRALYGSVKVQILVDGVLKASNEYASASPLPIGKVDGTTGNLLVVGNNAWFLAGGPQEVAQNYDGAIDNLIISCPQEKANAKLLGLWRFNEGSGTTAADASEYNNTMTIGSDFSWVAGFGSALSVDQGSNTWCHATISSDERPVNQVTIQAKIKWPNLYNGGDQANICGLADCATLSFTPGGNALRFQARVNTSLPDGMDVWPYVDYTNGPALLNDGEWHHVAGVFDGIPTNGKIHMYMYVDGQLVGTREVASTAEVKFAPELGIGDPNRTNIGVDFVVGGHPFFVASGFPLPDDGWYYTSLNYVGQIDEVQINSEVLDTFGCGMWGYLAGDINKDCKVDLADFAVLAESWLKCTNPDVPECVVQ